MKIVLNDGQIYEYDGNNIRVYGNNIVEAHAEDNVVVALDTKGRVHEYQNGKKVKSYGTGLIKIQLKNGVVIGNDINNFCNEYVDGMKSRSYLLK
jgi:hypothetical protein